MGRPDTAPLQVAELLRVLDTFAVRHVVVGGVAAIIHGATRPSFDVDTVPEWSVNNLERLAAALRSVGARLRLPGTGVRRSPPDAAALGRYELSTWQTPYGDLDVISGTPTPVRGRLAGYDDLVVRSHALRVFGMTVHVADLADLIESKEALRRGADLLALPELHRLLDRIEREVDWQRLAAGQRGSQRPRP